MTVDKTMRILTIYCLFHDCEEVELREITDHIPVQSTKGIQPVFPENKTQRRYMERMIRLCTIITHIDGEENPIGWYEEQFPDLSARTRQRDFALLNQMGISICYIPNDGVVPGHWQCDYYGAFSLTTLSDD